MEYWERVHHCDAVAAGDGIIELTFRAKSETWMRLRTEAALADVDINTTINELICSGEMSLSQPVQPPLWRREPAPWLLALVSMFIGALIGMGVSSWWI